ncbi:hypothetical protein CHS0354_042967 [Potamilus streckersoni]|uniref:Anaphase-promoting complex subunit 4-like WD40 domain-containing protein n=1 Tax=Potamilus streckersoni TaxID=2493646 RepID=A0AAE0T3J7_9BIVA|nr:hypothetical protein CHS0354_042967 [Potamilus streckersoni]
MAEHKYNVFVGSETGLLKGINIVRSSWDNLNSMEKADREKEICAMCWNNENESEICVGLKNQEIMIYDIPNKAFSGNFQFQGGKEKLKNVAKLNENIITAVDSGVVRVWKGDEITSEINAGQGLCKMAQDKSQANIIGTGGKENDLKIWDVNVPEKPIFHAKNVKNDWLNLRVPIWILDLEFFPGSKKVITCTGHHQVRVYDPSIPQRRPIMDIQFDEYPLTALSLRPNRDDQVIVSNTQGKMALMDLRKGQVVHIFKGFAGGIRDVQCHSSEPLVASCGLDRFLRIYDINTKQLMHKFYLKSRLNCLIFANKLSIEDEGQGEEKESGILKDSGEEQAYEADHGDEAVWNKLKVVQTKTIRKQKRQTYANETSVKVKRKTGEKEDSTERKKLKRNKKTNKSV